MKVQIRPRGPSSVRIKFTPGIPGLTPEFQVNTSTYAIESRYIGTSDTWTPIPGGDLDDIIGPYRTDAQNSAATATTQAGVATTKAEEASTSASTATTAASTATTKAGEASGSAQLAADWAEKPVDADVTTPGTRSALHHSAKAAAAQAAAELAASQAQQGVVPDAGVTIPKLASDVVALIDGKLVKTNNLSDLPDKPQALANLGALSSADGAVTLAKLANAPAKSLLGNDGTVAAVPKHLTVAEGQALLGQGSMLLASGALAAASALTFQLNAAPYSSFKKFRLWLYDVRPSTADQIVMRASTDGTNFISTASYANANRVENNTPAGAVGGGAITAAQITSGMSVGVSAGFGVCGYIDVDLTAIGLWTRHAVACLDSVGTLRYHLTGSAEIRAAVTHIRLLSLSGYTLTGQYALEGIRGIQ